MLDEFFRNLSRSTIVILSIVLGTLAIIAINPPHTVCDAQLDVFKESQTGFLFLNKKKEYIKTLDLDRFTKTCKEANSSGACLDLFVRLRKMHSQLRLLPQECNSKAFEIAELKRAVWGSLELMQKLAWGSQGPKSVYDKYAWLDSNHLNLFCILQNTANEASSPEKYAQWRENIMLNLPGAVNLSRQDLWSRSLFSTPCKDYLY